MELVECHVTKKMVTTGVSECKLCQDICAPALSHQWKLLNKIKSSGNKSGCTYEPLHKVQWSSIQEILPYEMEVVKVVFYSWSWTTSVLMPSIGSPNELVFAEPQRSHKAVFHCSGQLISYSILASHKMITMHDLDAMTIWIFVPLIILKNAKRYQIQWNFSDKQFLWY
jgi:hypothetical protein